MDSEVIKQLWIEAFKHQQGTHNQKRHGWRYVGPDSSKAQMSKFVKSSQDLEKTHGSYERDVFESRAVFLAKKLQPGQKPAEHRASMWSDIRKNTPKQPKANADARGYKPASEKSLEDMAKTVVAKKDTINVNSGEDGRLKVILAEQGFDGLPKKVTRAEMDAVVADGGIEMFRGVSGKAEYLAQFADGELFAGQGIYGNGTYTTINHSVAKRYGSDSMRMALRKNAKVIDYRKLEQMSDDADNKLTAEHQAKVKSLGDRMGKAYNPNNPSDPTFTDLQKQLVDEVTNFGNTMEIITDPGRFAATLGYDAIYKDKAGDDYYVILNRTAVIVQETFYHLGQEVTGGMVP